MNRYFMKKRLNIVTGCLAVVSLAALSGCTAGGDNPGIEYAPDMYVSKGYEAYTQTKKWENNPGGMSMRLPVKGTIAQGQMDYIYNLPDNGEGYEQAASLMPSVAATKTSVESGQLLYNTYCWNCHGKNGGNDGPVMQENRYVKPPWPNYQAEYIQNLPIGRIFHVLTYGKGLMGSHAIYLNPTERWQVAHYVKFLSKGEGNFVYAEEGKVNSSADTTQVKQ
jgi:mono/diheme cytochrome c family protein